MVRSFRRNDEHTCEQRVAHRLDDNVRLRTRGRERGVERNLRHLTLLLHVGLI